MCPLHALCCVCGFLSNSAPVHRCACSMPLVACAVSWASWLLFTNVPARCVVLHMRCPGALGSCSLVCWLGALCCVCGVMGHVAPVHHCACSVRCVACAVCCVIWLLFTGVAAQCVVLPVRCPRLLGSSSPVCSLNSLCCVCGVLGHLAPVYRGARLVRCVACAVSSATLLLFTGEPTCCVALRVRCPGPLGSCSPVCTPGALCCVHGVLGNLAPVYRCACLVCRAVCAVPSATCLLSTGAHARCVALCAWLPGPLDSCSTVCSLGVLCCVLCARCPGQICSCSSVCAWCAVLRVRGFAAGRTLVNADGCLPSPVGAG